MPLTITQASLECFVCTQAAKVSHVCDFQMKVTRRQAASEKSVTICMKASIALLTIPLKANNSVQKLLWQAFNQF